MRYETPTTSKEAAVLLAKEKGIAYVLAGGTDLLVRYRSGMVDPDLIVDRGETREYCAGSVAKVYEGLGGKVKYFGKPYPMIYQKSSNPENKKVLCIGDNLNTDIKGSNIQNFDSLFILNGIHKNENQNELNKLFEKYEVNVNYIQEKLKWSK